MLVACIGDIYGQRYCRVKAEPEFGKQDTVFSLSLSLSPSLSLTHTHTHIREEVEQALIYPKCRQKIIFPLQLADTWSLVFHHLTDRLTDFGCICQREIDCLRWPASHS
jgi:hypothetical protein